MVLKTEVEKYAKNELLVVSFCNKLYKRIALNWVAHLKKLHIIRKYLIKSYSGYCHALGKPVRGQRTWSNS